MSFRGLSRRLLTAVALLASILLGCTKPQPPPRMSAMVSYKDNLAIVKTPNSVSVVQFSGSGGRGDPVAYKYRQIIRGKKAEQAGSGKVFENYLTVPTGRNKRTHVANLGQLDVNLGVLSVQWSFAWDGGGYLYYNPAVVTVETRRAIDLEGFDLSNEAKW